MLKLTNRRAWIATLGIIVLVMIGIGVYYLTFRDPYVGRTLAVQPLPASYKLDEVTWVNEKIDYFPANGESHVPIPDLLSQAAIYYTNVDSATDYQFVQTGADTWGQHQRLFWRAGNSGAWLEIKLLQQYTATKGFASMNGHVYLVTEAGLRSVKSYLIDTKTGLAQAPFEATGIVVSPDMTKLAYLDPRNLDCGPHTALVWDLQHHTKMPLITLDDSDPCSGRSFTYQWSTDSKLLQIQDTAMHPKYVYDHSNKRLFEL